MQYLEKVSATYYFRRPVPPDIQAYFLTSSGKPRTDWKSTLGTKDRGEATQLCNLQAVETDKLIRETRAKLKAGIRPDRAPAAPLPRNQSPWSSLEELEGWEAGERQVAAEDAAAEAGLATDPIQRARQEGAEVALARRDRQDQEAREAFAEDAALARVPLMDLFDAYVVERQPAPATIKRWRPLMANLTDFLGQEDASRFTRKNVLDWKNALLSEKGEDGEPVRVARTVKEAHIAGLSVVLGFGVENGRLKSNVAADVIVRVPKKVRLRDPQFSKDEAQTILRAALQPQNVALSPEHKLARRWVPWLCAYTGARVNEMTQLRAQDVQEVEGIWTLRITPEAGGVKGNKARTVPLHEHMIAQGFLDVVEAKGEGPLFYNPARGRGGKDGNPHYKKVGERLAAWVRDIGVNDPNVQPNHGWRHLFKAIARRPGCRMDPHATDAIQGHAPRTEGENYAAPELPVLAEELKRFPRFETEAAA